MDAHYVGKATLAQRPAPYQPQPAVRGIGETERCLSLEPASANLPAGLCVAGYSRLTFEHRTRTMTKDLVCGLRRFGAPRRAVEAARRGVQNGRKHSPAMITTSSPQL